MSAEPPTNLTYDLYPLIYHAGGDVIDLPTQLMAAVRSASQLVQSLAAGADEITAPTSVWKLFFQNGHTDAVERLHHELAQGLRRPELAHGVLRVS